MIYQRSSNGSVKILFGVPAWGKDGERGTPTPGLRLQRPALDGDAVGRGGCDTSTPATAALVLPGAAPAHGGLLAVQGLGVGLGFSGWAWIFGVGLGFLGWAWVFWGGLGFFGVGLGFSVTNYGNHISGYIPEVGSGRLPPARG